MRTYVIFLGLTFAAVSTFAQNGNVGINTSTPHNSAALDITSADKGVLVPRISLVAANVASPVTSPANSLLVYNTATSGDGQNAVEPGFYYWSSESSRWMQMNQPSTPDNGFGSWGECAGSVFTHYNPVSASSGFNAQHGYCVALDGEYAIGGAPYDSSGNFTQGGTAWIYQRDGNTWTVNQELQCDDPAFYKYFGSSVDIDGNYAVIGAWGEDGGGFEDSGAAYVFHFNGTSWVQQAKLAPLVPTEIMLFGYSVAIDSHRVVIGAPYAVTGGVAKGAVMVYVRSGSTWTLQQTIVASDGQAGDLLGGAVDICDDMILAGAPRANVFGESDAGAAYYYNLVAGTWQELQKATSAEPVGGDEFGRAVSLDETYSLIGAPYAAANGNLSRGMAFLFYNDSGYWIYKQGLYNPTGEGGDEFGQSLSIDGDYAAIGSPVANPNGVGDQGIVTFFAKIGNLWKRIAPHLIEPTGEQSDKFGTSVSICGNQFIIGAPNMMGRGLVVFGKL